VFRPDSVPSGERMRQAPGFRVGPEVDHRGVPITTFELGELNPFTMLNPEAGPVDRITDNETAERVPGETFPQVPAQGELAPLGAGVIDNPFLSLLMQLIAPDVGQALAARVRENPFASGESP